MCDALEIDDLGLTKWDRRLLDPIVEFHSVFSLPKPNGWSRAESGARYELTPSGFIAAEDMSGRLLPTHGNRHLLVVGRDEKYVERRIHGQASRINHKTFRLLEVDWLWCLSPQQLTVQYKPIPMEWVKVVYVPEEERFSFRGAGKLFFTIFTNRRRYVVREITDERAKQYFERKCHALAVGERMVRECVASRRDGICGATVARRKRDCLFRRVRNLHSATGSGVSCGTLDRAIGNPGQGSDGHRVLGQWICLWSVPGRDQPID